MTRGMIVSGEFGSILVRQKAGEKLELGELFIAENKTTKVLLQVCNLTYGSQLDQQNIEMISGLKLEEDSSLPVMDAALRFYILGCVKNVLEITQGTAHAPKGLPDFLSPVRAITPQDFDFMHATENTLHLGLIRSGTHVLPVPVTIDGKSMLSHHILITGTTGRGKSVLMKYLLWNLLDTSYASLLVLDPHDEYYGRTTSGIKDHPKNREKLVYYTNHHPPPGALSLRIHLSLLKPTHFQGITDWSDAQREAIHAYHAQFGTSWIESIVKETPLRLQKFGEGTLAVLKRRFVQLLSLDIVENEVIGEGLFSLQGGHSCLSDILKHLREGKIVIVDTKHMNGLQELLIGSIIATEVLHAHRELPTNTLENMPHVSIVLEEAPRVIGKEVLEKGPNVFGTIAREGRKFQVGLIAITQLPSLIPREILANMNTKIILGTELKQERQAIMESAAQDLSKDDHLIASLDKGEAIITSTFTKFAIPIKIPLFEELIEKTKALRTPTAFVGIK